jgi:hypothetical protein
VSPIVAPFQPTYGLRCGWTGTHGQQPLSQLDSFALAEKSLQHVGWTASLCALERSANIVVPVLQGSDQDHWPARLLAKMTLHLCLKTHALFKASASPIMEPNESLVLGEFVVRPSGSIVPRRGLLPNRSMIGRAAGVTRKP